MATLGISYSVQIQGWGHTPVHSQSVHLASASPQLSRWLSYSGSSCCRFPKAQCQLHHKNNGRITGFFLLICDSLYEIEKVPMAATHNIDWNFLFGVINACPELTSITWILHLLGQQSLLLLFSNIQILADLVRYLLCVCGFGERRRRAMVRSFVICQL